MNVSRSEKTRGLAVDRLWTMATLVSLSLASWAGCQPVPKTTEPPATADYLTSGEQLYAKHCAVCHGANGKGDGPTGLNPPAADLTSPKVSTQLAPQLIRTVHTGRTDSAMGAWEQLLSDQDIEDVIAYVRHLRN